MEAIIPSAVITVVLASAAILAFAGNSLLARAALVDGAIDAGAFSLIRLASGAIVLFLLTRARPGKDNFPGAVSLAVYMAGFSLAYLSLGAAIGALILFTCVQFTIIAIGYGKGERLRLLSWIGLILAMAGLVVLLAPAGNSVPIGAAGMMAVAGVGWGVYTILGRGSGDATTRTARNFMLATPMILPMLLLDSLAPTMTGVILAVTAGSLTSGLGYVVWYKVAPRLALGTVASVQLATPLVAALGAVLFLSEPLDWRMMIGGAMILGGIFLTRD